MDTTALIVGTLIGLAIWAWILLEIIKSASKSAKIDQLLTIQSRLLMELLKQKGVSDDRIRDVINLKKKVLGEKA